MDRVTHTEQTLDRFQLQGADWYAKHYQVTLDNAIYWYEWIRDYEKGILDLAYLSFHCNLSLHEQEEPIEITPQALRQRCEESRDLLHKGRPIPDDLHVPWRLGRIVYASTYEIVPGIIAKVDDTYSSSILWFSYHEAIRWCDEQERK